MLKSLNGLYEGGQTRTPDQLKVKREIEVDGVVIDILAGKDETTKEAFF